MAGERGSNFGKNIGKGIGNAVGKVKNRADNGKNYDVMNPSEENPNAKSAKKQIGKAALKALKQVGKLIAKAVSTLVKALISAGPPGWIALAIIIVILFAAVIITSWNMMPGMMKSKLAELFKIDVSDWFMNGAVASLDENYSDIVNVANYLESMDYSLIGDGFVTPVLRKSSDTLTSEEIIANHPEYTFKADEDGINHFYDESGNLVSINYYDNLGQTISNVTGEVISGTEYTDEFGIIRTTEKSEDSDEDDRGKVAEINKDNFTDEELQEYLKHYRLLRTYLLSNYRIYSLKNADESVLVKLGDIFRSLGGNQDAWAKGLIKLYNAKGGIATGHWWWGRMVLGDAASIDGTNLTLKKGWFNNAMNFNIEGWAPRYGMSLEFLLSLHLGTNAPDLVNAMLQNFDTEVQVYLDDSGKAKVNARYIDPSQSGRDPATGDSIDKVETVLDEHGDWLSAWLVTDKGALEWFANDLALDKEACQTLLLDDSLTLSSPDTCLGEESAFVIEECTYQVDNFLMFDTSSNALEQYGIDEGKAEVYSNINSYQPNDFSYEKKGWFGDKSVTDATFDAKHVSQSIGVKDEYAEQNYTWLDGELYGYNAEGSGSMELTPRTNTFEVSSSFLSAEDKYSCEETILERHWTAEVDGEDVGYTWMTYKYIIVYLGTEIGYWDPFAINGGSAGFFHTNTFLTGDTEWRDTVMVEYIVRDKTFQELLDSDIINPDGTPKNTVEQRCSNQKNKKKCCANCQSYVKAAVKAMANVSDQDYSSYTPYIARVVGSWFRDTYFIIPYDRDVAINEYAGAVIGRSYVDDNGDTQDEAYDKNGNYVGLVSTEHPEWNVANSYYNSGQAKFVQVDEDYLADSGEYWTSYVLNSEGDYQLFVLRSNGVTSNTTMEEFLKDGKIDGTQAKVGNKTVTGYSSKEEAEKDGWAFVKKAKTTGLQEFSAEHTIGRDSSDRMDDQVLWSAYGFDSNGSATEWEKVTRADNNNDVNILYNIIYGTDEEGDDSSGIYYQLTKTNNVTQVEDAQRGETNPLIKYLFKYRQFYIYDGGESTALAIEHDKQRVLYGYNDYVNNSYDIEGKYYNSKIIANEYDIKDTPSSVTRENFYRYKGLIDSSGNGRLLNDYYGTTGTGWKSTVIGKLNKYGRSALRQSYSWGTVSDWVDSEDLASQWLDWQLDMYYMDKYGVDLKAYYNTTEDLLKIDYDPRDPDLIGTVEITKSSLSVFSILENTGTLDADYAYRDFKELIVELDYFDKEDLSSKNPEVFTWIIPDVSPAGWPNRPWDKQNVDYGTLVQSHDTYAALGVFDGAGSGNVNTSKLYWIGDSWTVGLVDNGLLEGTKTTASDGMDQVVTDNILAKVGASAYSLPGTPNPPDGTSGIVVGLGKNDIGASGSNAIKTLIDDLVKDHPDIPVYVLKLSYYGTSDKSADVDSFNQTMQTYCSSKENVNFVDPTGTINDTSGKKIKSEYNVSDNLHLNGDGYKAWYEDIISAVGGGGSTPTLTQTVSTSTTSSSEFEVKDGDGDCDKIVVANGISYKQFNQSGSYGSVNVYDGNTQIRTDSGDTTLSGMGCGIYSSTSLMSAYIQDVNPKNTVEWLHDNIGTSSFNNDGSRNTSMNKMLNDRGISGSWYSDNYESRLKEAFSAGKPVIINIKSGSQIWTTGDGHFICFTGISSDGKIYTADSVSGGGDRLCHSGGSDFDSAFSSLISNLVIGCVWIPDEAPTGVMIGSANGGGTAAVSYFQGYEADQNVASPVTGKILEIGTHERLNIYTGEMEEVEYIKIFVIDEKDYFDSRIDPNGDYGYETETSYEVNEALNLFYKEYEDVCTGYTVMLDGFDVDLSIEGGAYEQNEVHALYNSGQMEIRKEKEQAKEDAPFFINCGESEELPGDEYIVADKDSIVGYYVKEGKFIGKTITSDEELVSNEDADAQEDTENATDTENTEGEEAEENRSKSPLDDKLTYTYEDFAEIEDLTGDYIRITVQDTDYALVDDVETFFNIPEPEASGGLKFNSVNQEYQAWEGDLEVLAEVIKHESGGWEAYLTKYNVHGDEEAEFNGYCMGYSVVNKLLAQNKTYYGHLYTDSRTDMSPLVQVVTNQNGRWYGDPIPAEAMKVHNGEQGCYSDKDLEFAEFCLTYDSTSVIKPFDTVIGSDAASDGYTATNQGSPIPRAMCQQGGYGDGASGQSGIILVGFEDINKNGSFDTGDELFGVDRSMESLIDQ